MARADSVLLPLYAGPGPGGVQCVWINACVGNENQLAFLAFTTSAPLGCLHALLMQLVYLGWTPIPTTRCGNFDIILDHALARFSASHTHTHTRARARARRGLCSA